MSRASAIAPERSPSEGARPRTRLLALGLTLALMLIPALARAGDETLVADAAEAADATEVVRLLRQGSDANAAQGDGMTALHWAAIHGDAEMASVLVYAGANLRATTRLGAYTPLILAARYGRDDVLRALLDAGAEPNRKAATGASPLMFAAASGNVRTVEVLLERGAEVDLLDDARGQTALMFAAVENHVPAINALVAAGADLEIASTVIDVVAREQVAQTAFGKRRRMAAALAAIENPPDAAQEERPGEALEGREGERAAEGDKKDGDQATEAAAEDGDAARPVDAAAAANARAATGPDDETAATPTKVDEQGGPEGVVTAEEAQAAAAADPAAELQSRDAEAIAESAVHDNAAPDNSGEEGATATPGKETDEETARMEARGRLSYGELVVGQGGLTALHFAARQGHIESVQALLELGADVNHVSGGDDSSPLLIATINGHFELAQYLLDQGADPTQASAAGATPLYAAINVQWAPKTLYPQPRAHLQQRITHVDLMRSLLEAGADPNVRLDRKIWYSGYNFDLAGVDETGATPFWRAAYGSDVPAMKLLIEYGADPSVPTRKPAGRPRTGDATRDTDDISGLPPVPVGGPAVMPLHAATGVGYGEGFAANSHRNAPGGWLPAVKYLIEEIGADVNAVDHEGNTAVHMAAARGDNEMIRYLVSMGADVTKVNREGNTTVDMANGPVQRIQPFPETIALLESLGAVNNDKCVSC